MIELHLALVRHARRHLEAPERDVGVLEERHGLLRAELEEVVAERLRAQMRDEPRAEHLVPEPHRRVHVRRHQREMVDSAPERA